MKCTPYYLEQRSKMIILKYKSSKKCMGLSIVILTSIKQVIYMSCLLIYMFTMFIVQRGILIA